MKVKMVIAMEDIMVRVPLELIAKLREIFPELQYEPDSVLVRTALCKLIHNQQNQKD